MIKADMTPNKFCIRFVDDGVERCHYSDDRRYYERLVAEHGHLSGLQIDTVVLTGEQRQRLDEISSAGLDAHDTSIYVRYGTTESDDTGYYDADKLAAYHRAAVEPAVKAQRKSAEAEGVTIGGIRYAGDASNRQALQEALTFAADAGLETFDVWKDSGGVYHANVPVSDVEYALRKIGQRRNALISLEGQYVAQVAAGQTDIHNLDWATEQD